jgi:hypothetical protein
LKKGQIRLLDPLLFDEFRRPLYVALIAEWGPGAFLTAPFGPFLEPATKTEWLTGRQENSLRVLCLWNVRTVSTEVLQRSWHVDDLAAQELQDAWQVFRHATTGADLEERLLAQVGCPVVHPRDPRITYQEEEARLLAPLSAAVLGRSGEGETQAPADPSRSSRIEDKAPPLARSRLTLIPGMSHEGSICRLPGLAELAAEHEMALAAAEVRPSLAEYVFWTRDRQTMVIFRLEGNGKNLSISVWDAAGEESNKLDGCIIVGVEGQVLATILNGIARVPVEPFFSDFRIKTGAGTDVLIDPQP